MTYPRQYPGGWMKFAQVFQTAFDRMSTSAFDFSGYLIESRHGYAQWLLMVGKPNRLARQP
jgi:hypothetical protein